MHLFTTEDISPEAQPRSLHSSKRRALIRGAAAAIALPSLTAFAQTPARQLRIGHQKGVLSLLKGRGTLEKQLAPLNVSLKWTEFTAGPVQLEALNVGSIDFGDVGEAPPIFAQAAGAPLAYVAATVPRPQSEAVLVPKGSAIRSVADLKGRKVALNKGSNVHFLLVKALEKAGLSYADVQTVFLPPADARAAFERGAVDAWVIWDPFLAAAEKQLGARVLADGRGLVAYHLFYLAARPYADTRPQVIQAIVEELARLDRWAEGNPKAVAAFVGPQIGLDVGIAEVAAARFAYGIVPISTAVAAEQQKIADTFFELKLIPKAIRISDALPKSALTAQAR
jgi:sulfonate transport system substrate-binding protein